MNQVGTFPTPYGVSVKVFHDPSRATDADGGYYHDVEGCLTMAGIHNREKRALAKSAMQDAMRSGGVPFSVLIDHGGHQVPKEALVKPLVSVHAEMRQILPDGVSSEVVKNWETLCLDHSHWAGRAGDLLRAITDARQEMKRWPTPFPDDLRGFVISKTVTAGMELLAETEIDCIEAAAFYAVSGHDQWRAAGLRWLAQFRQSWFKDWIRTRPVYRRHAADCARAFSDIPAWVSGGLK